VKSCWLTFDPVGRKVRLAVHTQPNARTTAIAGLHGAALKVKVAAPAVDNKANAMLISFLHQLVKRPTSQIMITTGATSRRKVVEIADADAELASRIARLAP
jgi:uncharacterized protein